MLYVITLKLQNGVRKSFLNVICLLNVLYILVNYHENILFKVMVSTNYYNAGDKGRQGETTHGPSQLELSFLYLTPYRMPSTTGQFPENIYHHAIYERNPSKSLQNMRSYKL